MRTNGARRSSLSPLSPFPLYQKYRAARAYAVAPRVEAIQREILERGPVAAMMVLYEDFLVYSSGFASIVSESHWYKYRPISPRPFLP